MSEVCIVSMPYDYLNVPSIGVSQLVSGVKNKGIDAKAIHAKFWFAQKVGFENYNFLCTMTNPASLLGEWTFSKSAFPDFKVNDIEYLNYAISTFHNEEFIESILKEFCEHKKAIDYLFEMRNMANDFIDEAAARILDMDPSIVGCSSMFQQHCASIALLRKIKQINPKIITLMGGANCEGVMGQTTLKNFPWVDFVVSGEADLIFPDFCEKLLENRGSINQDKVPYGVISREYVSATLDSDKKAPSAMVDDMNSVPVPDYDDYFEEIKSFKYKDRLNPTLMLETSRGCWWGQKNRCTFCGLNGNNISFRMKSAERVLDETSILSEKHSQRKFFVSDNILGMDHFAHLIPSLSTENKAKYSFFFETKANLSEKQVIALKRAGVHRIQPGIESLNDKALKLLNKGTTAIINIALLKYAMENGVGVTWNYLIGMPGEEDAWNEETASFIPRIFHLEPPSGAGKIRFDRYSSYYYYPEKYGIKLSPYKTYSYVYPLDSEEILGIAYFFDDYSITDRGQGEGSKNLSSSVEIWKERFYGNINSPKKSELKENLRPQLIMSMGENITFITDTRDCAVNSEYCLEGLEHKVYEFLRSPRKIDNMLENFNINYGLNVKSIELQVVVERLEEYKIILILNGYVLSLATLETDYNKNRSKKQIPLFGWLKDL